MLMIDDGILQKAQVWLDGNYDQTTKNEIQKLIDNKEFDILSDSFYKDLEFGTGGIRGIMGPGTNRVNIYTIGKATQGLCNHLLQSYPGENISVAIAYDSRNNSDILSEVTRDVFTANGIKVYFFFEMRPTPQLSYAIRQFGCKSGVMLTASHNPREYNGYKAYGMDGCQVVTPEDRQIIEEVRKIDSLEQVNFKGNPDLVEIIDASFDDKFHNAVLSQCLDKKAVENQSDLKIVFTPLHGAGAVSVPLALNKMGFTNVIAVEEQMIPDGNFPTVIFPNPEEAEAMTMALNKAIKVDADIVMATDPDADRVGIAVKNDKGDFVLLNGNQTAVLIFDYVMNSWKKHGKITGKQYIVKTIVTSDLLDKMAEWYEVKCYNTLTGFKHLGSVITKLENKEEFIVGGEESYGYLIGDHARDKDAVVTCCVLAEMCAFYKENGQSMYDALKMLHWHHGLYQEKLISIKKEGKKGTEEIKKMMEGFRRKPPKYIAGGDVIRQKDFLEGKDYDLVNGTLSAIDLPVSNVLQFITADGTKVSARPSGTEPKIKFYCSVNKKLKEGEDYESAVSELNSKIDHILSDLGLL
ncbi:MAG: phospho-sugar mutase [Saprospiraceae bacterium]